MGPAVRPLWAAGGALGALVGLDPASAATLLDALLPHLPQPEEGADFIEALWTRLSSPATHPSLTLSPPPSVEHPQWRCGDPSASPSPSPSRPREL